LVEFDVQNTPVVDAHCHGWHLAELRARPPEAFPRRLSITGMFLSASGQGVRDYGSILEAMTELDPLVSTAITRLARHLDCEPTPAAVSAARDSRLAADPGKYLAGLWRDAHMTGLLVDDGYPQPPVHPAEFSREIGIAVHQVARSDVAIDRLIRDATSYNDLADSFADWVSNTARDGAVAFKSVIAYRTGLEVRNWSRLEAAQAFLDWRNAGFSADHGAAKPVRDSLLERLLAACKENGKPVHIHSGAGDPSMKLDQARPALLFGLLSSHRDQPIVLVHAGWPWLEDAAYLGSAFPNVYLETSVTTPWSSLALDRRLELILGMVSPAKVLHGTDEATEPELIWLGAHVAKEALARVLRKAVSDGWYTQSQAQTVIGSVLGGNALRLHGLSPAESVV
jgi:uncharacterized protein